MGKNSHVLMPLQPMGIGTEEVESLASYIFRQADLHCCSPRRLVEWICSVSSALTKNISMSIVASQPIKLIRPTDLNAQFIKGLSETCSLTISQIKRMTYLDLNKPVQRSPKCYSSTFRWCDLCLQESFEKNEPPYYRLVWGLEGYTHCHFHLTKLKDKCPICNLQQKGWGHQMQIFQCKSCGADFCDAMYLSETINRWHLESNDLLQLTKDISEGNGWSYSANGPKKVLQKTYEDAWEREDEIDYFRKIPRDECLAYLLNDKPITLTTTRRLSARLGINIIEMMKGVVGETTRQLMPEWSIQLPPGLALKKRTTWSNREEIKKAIQSKSIFTERPSLRSVARKYEVSIGGLQYHFPKESKLISQRYLLRCKAERKNKYIAARKLIYEALIDWHATKPVAPSKKGILRELFPSSGLPKNLLREEISRILDNISKEYTRC